MILKRFYDDKLAQASYLVGCDKTGEGVVIDPNRDVEQYLAAAESEKLRITAVTETHIHADYVSGSRELAERSGAQLYLSDEGDDEWKYAFADQPNVTLVRDGDEIRVGKVLLTVRKTPGHTPEHISFVVTDTAASNSPLGAFTGDFIFVGDVGRPDLLERAAGFEGTMRKGAEVLFNSIQKFKADNPEYLLIWPAHGAGSACGKALGGVPVSTLGYEKNANWALRSNSAEEFVDCVLEGQPEPPLYFKHMKRINKMGPPLLDGFRIPPRLAGGAIFDLMSKGAVIVDTRSSPQVSSGYIPGTIHIPEDSSFTTWAGWLLPYDKPIYLLTSSESQAIQATKDLAMIGLDEVAGWVGPDALSLWEKRFGSLELIENISAREAFDGQQSGELQVLDVRGLGEYADGHVPGSQHITLGYIPERGREVSKAKPVALMCGGGSRSVIGLVLLRKQGFEKLLNLKDGYFEYKQTGLPIETGTSEPALSV
jgi:hydroxyacylglutathione hydrolase